MRQSAASGIGCADSTRQTAVNMSALDAHTLASWRDDGSRGTFVELSGVRFSWAGTAPPMVDIERLQIARGERVFLREPSGSGKSTLLSLIAGVVTPREGAVRILERDIGVLGNAGRDRFRADHIGFIFQMFNLIPYLSVLENVSLPCGFSARRKARAGGNVGAEAMRLLEPRRRTQSGRRPVIVGLAIKRLRNRKFTAALTVLSIALAVLLLLGVQRTVNEYPGEPLTAILPGPTLQEVWDVLGVAEKTLFAVSALVVVVGLAGTHGVSGEPDCALPAGPREFEPPGSG